VLQRGDEFEGYVLDEVVGHGGFATVYRAHDAADAGRVVALKVLADDDASRAESARLQREFDFARGLRHPHVVSVERRGDWWLTMQFVDGGTSFRLQSLEERLTSLAQIADALDYVHHCGIVHCDVKPSNILVHKDFSRGGAVLIDFGVAYAVAEDHRKRPWVDTSLPYSAPEMLRGHKPSAATDEYSLACTAVELITGAPPFEASTSVALMDAQLYDPPPQISRRIDWVPKAFDSVIGRALAKDREIRYETCTEFVTLITKVLRYHHVTG
jgi:eukaryotic-like serine/threonine-protein kinase